MHQIIPAIEITQSRERAVTVMTSAARGFADTHGLRSDIRLMISPSYERDVQALNLLLDAAAGIVVCDELRRVLKLARLINSTSAVDHYDLAGIWDDMETVAGQAATEERERDMEGR